MPKISKKEEEKFEIPVREYSDMELGKFHEMVQKYYYTHTFNNGETLRVLNQFKLRIAYGAISRYGGVILGRYPQFENIYEKWQYWKIRTGLDEGSWNHNKLQSLDKVAQEMTVEPSIEEIPF
jgi:hypothetical protein